MLEEDLSMLFFKLAEIMVFISIFSFSFPLLYILFSPQRKKAKRKNIQKGVKRLFQESYQSIEQKSILDKIIMKMTFSNTLKNCLNLRQKHYFPEQKKKSKKQVKFETQNIEIVTYNQQQPPSSLLTQIAFQKEGKMEDLLEITNTSVEWA